MNAHWIDVREYPEFAGGHIAGSKLVPLGTLEAESKSWDKAMPITLVCRSGSRAEQARQQLVTDGFSDLTVLAGGVEAWKADGKPLVSLAAVPWAMERQVRVVAGSLVVVFVALGFFVSRFLFAGAALIGAGLVIAGVSDTCMMASVLGRMPWNRAPKAAAA